MAFFSSFADARREREMRRAIFEVNERQHEFTQEWSFRNEQALVGRGNLQALQRYQNTHGIWKTAADGDLAAFRALESTVDVVTLRGVFSETLLHVTLFYHSDGHRELVRYLCDAYPSLINTAYSREPLLGETPLHMAIINGDDELIQLFLEKGADTTMAATGHFFVPTGSIYYGEYPLSFAACYENKKAVDMLIAAGADMYARDTVLGNTLLHMLVLYNRVDMYRYVMEAAKALEVDPDIPDSGLVPTSALRDVSVRVDERGNLHATHRDDGQDRDDGTEKANATRVVGAAVMTVAEHFSDDDGDDGDDDDDDDDDNDADDEGGEAAPKTKKTKTVPLNDIAPSSSSSSSKGLPRKKSSTKSAATPTSLTASSSEGVARSQQPQPQPQQQQRPSLAAGTADAIASSSSSTSTAANRPKPPSTAPFLVDDAGRRRIDGTSLSGGGGTIGKHSVLTTVTSSGGATLASSVPNPARYNVPLDLIVNEAGRTPLQFAAELGNRDMFEALISQEKIVLWSYGKVQAVAYPLDQLDTVRQVRPLAGMPTDQRKGALQLITEGTNAGHHVLLESTPVLQLLQAKWEIFAKWLMYIALVVHLAQLLLFTIVVSSEDRLTSNPSAKAGIELTVLTYAAVTILNESFDLARSGWNYFLTKGTRLFYMFSWMYSLSLFATVIVRYTYSIPSGDERVENYLLGFAAIAGWAYVLFFARAFRSFGIIVILVHRLIADVLNFVLVYILLLIGFGLAFFLFFIGENEAGYSNFGISLLSLYKVLLGDFNTLADIDSGLSSNASRGIVIFVFLVYSIVVSVMMMNILIAMMNYTFSNIQTQAQLQWRMEWAQLILYIERRVPRFFRPICRTGKMGHDLGLENDHFYLVLEERNEGTRRRHFPTVQHFEYEEQIERKARRREHKAEDNVKGKNWASGLLSKGIDMLRRTDIEMSEMRSGSSSTANIRTSSSQQ